MTVALWSDGADKNVIVLSAAPAGRFLEGYISGTPKPGMLMQIKAGVAAIMGRLTWEIFNGAADAERCMIAILLEDNLQGKTTEDAYENGKRCRLYCPLMGDEVNVRVGAPGTGTGNAITIGDKFLLDDGTGICVATTGSPESEPFIAAEDVADVVAAGTLVHCFYTGY